MMMPHCPDCNGRGGGVGQRIQMPHVIALGRHAIWLIQYQQVDPPQCFPLSVVLVAAIDIPPSLHGWMVQRDPHVQHPRPMRRLILQALRLRWYPPYSSSGAAAAVEGGRRQQHLLSMARGGQWQQQWH